MGQDNIETIIDETDKVILADIKDRLKNRYSQISSAIEKEGNTDTEYIRIVHNGDPLIIVGYLVGRIYFDHEFKITKYEVNKETRLITYSDEMRDHRIVFYSGDPAHTIAIQVFKSNQKK